MPPSLLALALAAADPRSFCEIASVLRAYDGEAITLRGNILFDRERGVFALSAKCDSGDDQVRIRAHVRSNLVHLELSSAGAAVVSAADSLKAEFQKARDNGRMIQAAATVSGVMDVVTNGEDGFGTEKRAPAQLRLTAFSDVAIEPLAKPEELPVIPVCELFRNLPAHRGKRVAVRGFVAAGMEGAWLGDRCESGFVTRGYRWPVSLSLGSPDDYISPSEEELAKLLATRRRQPYSFTLDTVVGTIRLKDDYFVNCMQGEFRGIGFGHLGGAGAEILVEKTLDSQPATPPRAESAPDPKQSCPVRKPRSAEECAGLTDARQAAAAGCAERAAALVGDDLARFNATLLAGADWPQVIQVVGAKFAIFRAQLDAAIRAGDTAAVEKFLRQMKFHRFDIGIGPAVQYGDRRMVRLLLAKGAKLNAVGPLGSPVHIAVLFERWDTLRALVADGADVNIKDADGRTPLAAYGLVSVKALRELVATGVDIKASIHGSPSILVRAITHGSPPDVVRALLEAGVAASATDSAGDSALHHAVRSKRWDVIAVLREFGAAVDLRNNSGFTPIDLARQTGGYPAELMELTRK